MLVSYRKTTLQVHRTIVPFDGNSRRAYYVGMTIANPALNRIGILALDQSTKMVGHSTWVNGTLESWGQFKPDFPRLDYLRNFVRDYCYQFKAEGRSPVVVCEDIYYSKNVLTFRQLSILLGHIQAVTYDSGAEFCLITADEALYAITGKRERLVREVRKQTITALASRMAGRPLRQDESDSIAVGVAYLQKLR